jgi:transcriptional regulator with XRE-family HTH domain
MSDTGHAARARRWITVLDGQRLRELRRENGLSRDKLAALAGVSLTTVVRLESQPQLSCRTRTLVRLAAALGQHPSTITGGHYAGPRDIT